MDEIKILFFTDNTAHAKLLEVYLATTASFKFILTKVATIEQCLNELNNKQFDVVILDLELQDNNNVNSYDRVIEKCKEQLISIITIGTNSIWKKSRVDVGDYLSNKKLRIDRLSREILYANERNKLLQHIRSLTQKIERAELRIKILEGDKSSN